MHYVDAASASARPANPMPISPKKPRRVGWQQESVDEGEAAMEAMLQSNDAEAFLVLVARMLQRAFDRAVGRFRPAVGEEDSLERAAREFGEPLGERQGDAAVVAAGHLQEAAGLLA